ncbi:unnamed protein product [Arctogadus glacialis]
MFEGGWGIGVGSEGRGKTSDFTQRRTGLVLSPSTTRLKERHKGHSVSLITRSFLLARCSADDCLRLFSESE